MKKSQDSLKDSKIELEISSFATFADYFFDGFIIDWFVLSKIQKASTDTKNLKSKVQRIIRNIDEQCVQVKNELENLLSQKNQHVENA